MGHRRALFASLDKSLCKGGHLPPEKGVMPKKQINDEPRRQICKIDPVGRTKRPSTYSNNNNYKKNKRIECKIKSREKIKKSGAPVLWGRGKRSRPTAQSRVSSMSHPSRRVPGEVVLLYRVLKKVPPRQKNHLSGTRTIRHKPLFNSSITSCAATEGEGPSPKIKRRTSSGPSQPRRIPP